MSHKLVFINRKLILLIKILVFSPKKTSLKLVFFIHEKNTESPWEDKSFPMKAAV